MAITRRKGKKGTTYQVHVYDPGLQRKRYVGTRDKLRGPGGAEELERRAADKLAGYAPEGRTTRDYAPDWLTNHHGPRTRRPAPATRLHNEHNLRPFLEEFGTRPLDGGISRTEALAWGKAHPHQARTVSAMFNDAMDEELCASNPFANRRQESPQGRKHIHPLTAEEVGRLADIAERHWGSDGYGQVARAWVLFGAWVGCRPGETFGVTQADLNLPEGEVAIRRVKRRGGRYPVDTVVLPGAVTQALSRLTLPDHGPVFLTVTGKPMVKGSLRYHWDPIRSAFRQTVSEERWGELLDGSEDGKSLDFYALRHFCASQIVAAGGNEFDVSAQLGNSPQVAREVYIHSYTDEANDRNRRFLNGPDVVDLTAARQRRRNA